MKKKGLANDGPTSTNQYQGKLCEKGNITKARHVKGIFGSEWKRRQILKCRSETLKQNIRETREVDDAMRAGMHGNQK
jgi:hypothetical protein